MRAEVVGVVLTTFNRREYTLRCLAGLFAQSATAQRPVTLAVVIADDLSSDGTVNAVRDTFPSVTITETEGDFYWAAGMRRASQKLQEIEPDFDWMLWINDDVELDIDAIARALDAARAASPPAIVVGATRDPDSGATSYSGFRRIGRRPLQLQRVDASTHAQELDTLNGNFALFPRAIVDRVGMIDGRYRHAFADIDYGYTARQAGFSIVLLPGYVGSCEPNRKAGDINDPKVARRRRLQMLIGPKGLPPRSMLILYRRHGTWDWPLQIVGGYFLALVRILVRRPVNR